MVKKRPSVIYYRPSRVLGALAIILLLLLVALLLGELLLDRALMQSKKDNQQLQIQVAALEKNLAANQNTLIKLQLTADIDAAALEQARQEMVAMQSQIYQRDKELVLYREMLQDNQQPSGLSIFNLKLNQLNERRFRYSWVARQKTEQKKTLRVDAKLWVVGMQNDKPLTLPMDQLDAKIKALPIQLSFKYFSMNEGILELPEGFTPQAVRVTLRYPWANKPQLDKQYDWQIED
jgi:hypothetical protein